MFQNPKRFAFVALMLVAATCSSFVAAGAGESRPVTIFAAASLRNALDDVMAALQRETGEKVIASYAASSAMARQIEAGAPADIFISADEAWMDDLAKKGLIVAETRADLLANEIVLVAPRESAVTLKIEPGFALNDALDGGRLAVANVESVPAGRYAKASLLSLGAWESVKDRLAESENVRAALALVATAEAPLGIVYRTDVAAEPNVRIVGKFPAKSHPPIVYPIAVVRATTALDAASRVAGFLKGTTAAGIFTGHGFAMAPKKHEQEPAH